MDRWERTHQAAVGLLTLALLCTTFAQFVPWRAEVQQFSGQGDFRELYLPWGVEYRVNLPGRTLVQDSRSYWDDGLYRTAATREEDGRPVTVTTEAHPAVPLMLRSVLPLEIAGMVLALAAATLWVLAPVSAWRARLAGLAGAALLLALVLLLSGTSLLLEARGSVPAASYWVAVPAAGAVSALLAAALPLLEGPHPSDARPRR